jgi:hypothetical protein
MNLTEAQRFIELHLQPAVDPTLTDDEVDQIVTMARAVDEAGLTPSDDDWTATYSVAGCHYAIAEGYQVKYAKAVGRFSFTTDGQTFTRNQTLDHLEHQRAKHLAKVQATVGTGFPPC